MIDFDKGISAAILMFKAEYQVKTVPNARGVKSMMKTVVMTLQKQTYNCFKISTQVFV